LVLVGLDSVLGGTSSNPTRTLPLFFQSLIWTGVVSNRNGDSDIWVRDLETGQDRQLTFSREDEFRALISPDGSRVLYARQASDLYTIPFEGGEETLVCEKCGVVSNWSPDGKKVLYQ